MPLAKLKFVVSCSDSERGFGAENLLGQGKSGRTKWRGKAGAASNVAVIQLEREYRISSVDIGNEFSALVSVLVSKSCDPKQNFQTLIPSSSFMDPMESRLAKNGNRVRMFHEDDMIATTAQSKWDIVKIVCTQPFNQAVPYGISFITITVEGDEKTGPSNSTAGNRTTTAPKLPLITRVEALKNSLKAGDMFKQKAGYSSDQAPSTSGANKSVSEKNKGTERDGQPRDAAHEKQLEKPERKRFKLTKNKENETNFDAPNPNTTSKASTSKAVDTPVHIKKPATKESKTSSSGSKPLNEILHGVRFSLSGYQNPLRSILRDKAKELGAIYENDWSDRCTHLICAFPNTPKYRQVGNSGFIVTDKWLDMCYINKRRMPEKHYAL